MHTHASSNQSSAWISHIQQTVPTTGQLTTQDKIGAPVILAWTAYNPASPEFTQAIRHIHEVFTQTYVRQELEFARKRPDAVSEQMFLKATAPLFEHGIDTVDWQAVEQQVTATLRNFFTTQDFAQWASSHDVTLLIIAKTQEGKVLGAIQLSSTPEYAYGTWRVGLTGVLSNSINRGLESLLMSAVFKIAPETTRLFLHTRATNEQMVSLYQEWGFTQLTGTNVDWPDFEYQTTSSDALQTIAATFTRLD